MINNRYYNGFGDYTEDDYIEFITDWTVVNQFGRIDEIMNKHIGISKDSSSNIYTLHFNVRGVRYIFRARREESNTYGIIFYDLSGRNPLDMFEPRLNDRQFVGDVYSGVFLSLKRLVSDETVDFFHFHTNNKKLISLYDKMTKYIERRFDYTLHDRLVFNDTVQWMYKKNMK